MKILHTADLHLGKRLNTARRLDEQRAVLREIAELSDAEDVDVILIAGDVFDASVPPSDAERVFYRGMKTLAEHGRAVIALAGNHDDERRLCAAKPFADTLGVVLAGELDYSDIQNDKFTDEAPPASLLALSDAADYLQKQRIKITGHYGGITVEKDGERANIALVPYPSEGRMKRWEPEQDYTLSYTERVKLLLEKACAFFDDGYNILCTHLFLTKSAAEDALGGLMALPTSVLPEKPDYVALGHVHKYLRISKSPLAEYSGSPLQYAYDESRNKSVNIIDTVKRTVTPTVLRSGKKLTEAEADNFDECMARLETYADDYVRIKYAGDPLGKDEAIKIKSHPAFNDLVIVSTTVGGYNGERRAHLSDSEIFEMFYKQQKDKEPRAELKAIFEELIEELKNESAFNA